MLVKATDRSIKLQIKIDELGRVALPDEEFEVSSNRYEILSGRNKYHAVFVLPVKEQKEEIIEEYEYQSPISEVVDPTIPLPQDPEQRPKKKKKNKQQIIDVPTDPTLENE